MTFGIRQSILQPPYHTSSMNEQQSTTTLPHRPFCGLTTTNRPKPPDPYDTNFTIQTSRSIQQQNPPPWSHEKRSTQITPKPPDPEQTRRPSRSISIKMVSLLFTVTSQTFYQKFSKFGVIECLQVDRKYPTLCVTIRYQFLESAIAAKLTMGNRFLQEVGGTMTIDYVDDEEECLSRYSSSLSVDVDAQQVSRILAVSIHNPWYAITEEVLHAIFAYYGVIKILPIDPVDAVVIAIIEFQSQGNAMAARNDLQGRCIYDNCCQLSIEFAAEHKDVQATKMIYHEPNTEQLCATPTVRYAPEDQALPKPWRGLVDGKTGYLYFWNPETNVTQYERPMNEEDENVATPVDVESGSIKLHLGAPEREGSDNWRCITDTVEESEDANVDVKSMTSEMDKPTFSELEEKQLYAHEMFDKRPELDEVPLTMDYIIGKPPYNAGEGMTSVYEEAQTRSNEVEVQKSGVNVFDEYPVGVKVIYDNLVVDPFYASQMLFDELLYKEDKHQVVAEQISYDAYDDEDAYEGIVNMASNEEVNVVSEDFNASGNQMFDPGISGRKLDDSIGMESMCNPPTSILEMSRYDSTLDANAVSTVNVEGNSAKRMPLYSMFSSESNMLNLNCIPVNLNENVVFNEPETEGHYCSDEMSRSISSEHIELSMGKREVEKSSLDNHSEQIAIDYKAADDLYSTGLDINQTKVKVQAPSMSNTPRSHQTLCVDSRKKEDTKLAIVCLQSDMKKNNVEQHEMELYSSTHQNWPEEVEAETSTKSDFPFLQKNVNNGVSCKQDGTDYSVKHTINSAPHEWETVSQKRNKGKASLNLQAPSARPGQLVINIQHTSKDHFSQEIFTVNPGQHHMTITLDCNVEVLKESEEYTEDDDDNEHSSIGASNEGGGSKDNDEQGHMVESERPKSLRLEDVTSMCPWDPDIDTQLKFISAKTKIMRLHFPEKMDDDKATKKDDSSDELRELFFGRIHVIVKSDLCWMNELDKADCDFEHGGYFIVKGAKRTFIAQEQICLRRLWLDSSPNCMDSYHSVLIEADISDNGLSKHDLIEVHFTDGADPSLELQLKFKIAIYIEPDSDTRITKRLLVDGLSFGYKLEAEDVVMNRDVFSHPWDPGITYLGTSMLLVEGSVMALEDKDLKGKGMSWEEADKYREYQGRAVQEGHHTNHHKSEHSTSLLFNLCSEHKSCLVYILAPMKSIYRHCNLCLGIKK